jgi:hypothetical protein
MEPSAAVELAAAMEPSAAVDPSAAVELWAAVEAWAASVEMVVIDERAAVRDIALVVVHHFPVAPVGVPVVPSPAESAEVADPEADSE